MNNYISKGDNFKFTLGSGQTAVVVGAPLKVGNIVGVVASLTRNNQTVFINQASAEGDEAILATTGIFEVAKAAPLVIAAGDALYFDVADNNVNKTAAGNTLMGYAVTPALSAATTVEIMLAYQPVQAT